MNFQIVSFEAAYGKSSQIPPSDLPEIVFSGRSNVGKSSLINKILNRKALARVSATPGKTATINFFNLKTVRLADLPGYGYAKVSDSEKRRWAELVEGYFAMNRDIRMVIQICDLRHPATKDDMNMIDFLSHNGFNFIVAITKLDKLKKSQRATRIEEMRQQMSVFGDVRLFPCSSENGEGVEEIRKAIEAAAEGEQIN